MKVLLESREQAGRLLSRKLKAFKDTNTVVVGIPHGGVCVAAVIARQLDLPLEVIPCRRIKHPSDEKKCLGCVCQEEVFIPDLTFNIPQDYISHQVELQRSALKHEQNFYYGDRQPTPLRGKTVILVDDNLKSSDSITACFSSLQKQNPDKVVVAVPLISADAARIIGAKADIIFLRIEPYIRSAKEYYSDFPEIDAERVKQLLTESRAMFHHAPSPSLNEPLISTP